MLAASGIAFTVELASVDEEAVRAALFDSDEPGAVDPADVAEILAAAKAESVSRLHPDAFVIGGDQVLAFEGATLSKPRDVMAARQQLSSFRGKTHALHSAVALTRGGEMLWSMVDTAEMHVRDFSDAFLDDYMRRAGRSVLDSVGAYLMEGLGIQLFDRIDGDYFTVLGMPLMPLLAELRARKIILS
ncbi:MAG: Maf family protein [Hyphomicrobiaceae bacterium]|nr:Maf family protein [Hyphomicrobiaceae bacterium]